jgi:hypothetical protein
MTDRSYLVQVIQLYLDLPGTPNVAHDNDWAVAAGFLRQNVSLHTIAHALRLATLRRHSDDAATPPETVHSLAYYRRVIANLTSHELDPDYIAYIEKRFSRFLIQPPPQKTLSENRNTALLENR